MGISGLLPALKSITHDVHLRNYAGHTLGVDAYVWLHRGAFACAWDLANDIHTTRYVDYVMHRIKMLQHFGVTPFLVLDGGYLPSKAHTEDGRLKKREEAMAAGRTFQAKGNRKAAQDCYTKAVDVTPEMALRLIHALQAANIQFIVAPYEADAQLAYLERKNIIHGIITEDSDLLVFGCRRVLFKLNEFGDCVEIEQTRLTQNKEMPMAGWSEDRFRWMAILSGCDYLTSIPGLGLKRAHAFVKRHKTLPALFKALRLETGFRMPADYEAQFMLAEQTFLHQRVYCPDAKKLVLWNAPAQPLSEEALARIGEPLEDDVAQQVALGLLDPITKKPIVLQTTDAASAKKHKAFANAAAGTRPIASFLVPTRPAATTASPLQERSLNAGVVRKPAPLTLRESQRAKKLKLFESSPSPESLKAGAGAVLQAYGIALGDDDGQTTAGAGTGSPRGLLGQKALQGKENAVSPFFAKRTPTPTTVKTKAVGSQPLLRKNVAVSARPPWSRPVFSARAAPTLTMATTTATPRPAHVQTAAVSPQRASPATTDYFDSDPAYEQALAEALDASAREAETQAKLVQAEAAMIRESAAAADVAAAAATSTHVSDRAVSPQDLPAAAHAGEEAIDGSEMGSDWQKAFACPTAPSTRQSPAKHGVVPTQRLPARRTPFFAQVAPIPAQPTREVSKTTAFYVQPSETRRALQVGLPAARPVDLSAFKFAR